ncbi:MAG: response regulator [Lachnospiraceae bacterium]|nr:response regulator [Lachnospiraceae bacterium]
MLNIGEIIKKHRTDRNITQEEMAAALHVTPQAISRWETGISYPDIAMLPQISKYLMVSTDTLLGCKSAHDNTTKEVLNQSQVDAIFDYVPQTAGTGKRILTIDDAPFMRKMLKDILSSAGHTVFEAPDAASGINVLETEQLDICILDINMPEMNGIEALEIIRKKHPDLKIIMLSIQSTEETVRKALELCADGFVAKPFAPNSLLERMN